MVRQIYAIYDRVGNEFVGPLMLFPSDVAARRTFVDALADPQSQLSKHPGDYVLYRVGDFDISLGAITPVLDVLGDPAVFDGDLLGEDNGNGS